MNDADSHDLPFWERPETVARFSKLEPDRRLAALVREYPEPGRAGVLDLGCAGGRNSVFLAERGFDLLAVDSSRAMVAETRRRVAAVLGDAEAAERVRLGAMDRLDFVPDASVELIVSIGVFHGARNRAEWDRTLLESFRVLGPGGRLLVGTHTDEFRSGAEPLPPVEGEPHVFVRESGRAFLVDADTLDREMARCGFVRLAATETLRRETEDGGLRVTANGFYGKPA